MLSIATHLSSLETLSHLFSFGKLSKSLESNQISPYTKAVESDCSVGAVAETITPSGEVFDKLKPLASEVTFL